MLGVDVGGHVHGRRGDPRRRIDGDEGAERAGRAGEAVVEGARRLGRRGQRGVQPRQHDGLNAVITRRLPKIGFLTTEGIRDMLDRGRVWRPLDAPDRSELAALVRRRPRPLVPRYLRRGRRASGSWPTAACCSRSTRSTPAGSSRCSRAATSRASRSACSTPTSTHAHEERLRELTREVLGDVPVSISSETSPLAKEYARASTTVVDVFMKLIFTRYAQRLDAGASATSASTASSTSPTAPRRCSLEEALEQPFRIVFAGPAAGTISSTRLGEAIGRRQPPLRRRRRHLDRRVARARRAAVRQRHLRAGARPDHQRALDRDLERRRGRRQHRRRSRPPATSWSARRAPGRSRARPATGAAATDPTLTDACLLMGILDPDGLCGRRAAARRRAARARVRVARHVAGASTARRVRVPDRRGEHRRRGTRTSRSATASIPATSPSSPTAPPGRCCCRLRSSCCTRERVVVPPHPGLFSALGLLSTDLVYYESRSAYVVLAPEAAPRSTRCSRRWRSGCARSVGGGADGMTVRRSFDGRLLGQSWETPFVEVPEGPITEATIRELVERFHAEYERRYGNRFPYMPVQGVTYRVSSSCRPTRSSTSPPGAGGTTRRAGRTLDVRYLDAEPLEAGEYARESLRRARVTGPGGDPRGLSTTFVCPEQRPRSAARRDRHRARRRR